MRLVSDNRASRILYNVLLSNDFVKPFALPANVCEIVPRTFELAHVPFVFVDIDPITLCIDIKEITGSVHNFSGILFVHSYGLESSFEFFFQLLKTQAPDFFIIDDSCLCMPQSSVRTTKADVVLYSVGSKKQVNMGHGGFAFLSDTCKYRTIQLPYGSFLDDSNWIVDFDLLMENITKSVAHKKNLNAIYENNLPQEIQLPTNYQNWRFNIFVKEKERILEKLFSQGLFASSHYKSLSSVYKQSACKHADYLSQHIVNLFNDHYYTWEMAFQTCEIINSCI